MSQSIKGIETGTGGARNIIADQYYAVRERVGFQNLSGLPKIILSGADAIALCNSLILTDLTRLPTNQMQPSVMLDDAGRMIADIQILNRGTHLLVLADGDNRADILARFNGAKCNFPDVTIKDETDQLALFSVDGPYSWELLKVFLGLGIIGVRFLEVVPEQQIADVPVTLCRAGKTGEYGYLLLAEGQHQQALQAALEEAGKPFDMREFGQEAAALFRLENRVLNPAAEGAAAGNVLELNTRVMFSRDKSDHAGRAALLRVIDQGVAQRLTGICFTALTDETGVTIPPGSRLTAGGCKVGTLVTASYSFTLGHWIGLAMIDEACACVGLMLSVVTPDGEQRCHSVSAPFIFNKSMSIRPQEDSFFH